MGLLVWILIAYGITSIINWGSIFETPREWIKRNIPFLGELITCTLCTATWVGFIMSLLLGSITQNYFETHYIINIFLDGMLTAGSVWGLNAIIEYFEENKPENE
jgi:general stress protein CsbA